jgi:hypothetical protein
MKLVGSYLLQEDVLVRSLYKVQYGLEVIWKEAIVV